MRQLSSLRLSALRGLHLLLPVFRMTELRAGQICGLWLITKHVIRTVIEWLIEVLTCTGVCNTKDCLLEQDSSTHFNDISVELNVEVSAV